MKDITLIFPFVMPSVPNAPAPLVIQHIRQAAIEFCRKSKVLHATVVTPSVANQSTYSLALAGHDVSALLGVYLDGLPIDVFGLEEVLDRQAQAGTSMFAWLDGDSLKLSQAPPVVGQDITVNLVRTPSLAATEIADILVDRYAQDIAYGAIASLSLLPEYRDMVSAQDASGKSEKRQASASLAVSRAGGRGYKRAKAHYF